MAESKSNFLTLGVDKDNAFHHIRMAYAAGSIVIVISFIAVLITIFYKPILGLDAWSLADVIVIAILTYGIYKENRIAAVIIAILWPIEKIGQFISSGEVPPISMIFSILFEIAFIRGAIATFLIDRKEKKKNKKSTSSKK